MNRFDVESEIAIQNEIWRQRENALMADNLKRIDKLSRRGLLLFLDKERSKSNTARLRTKARLIAIAENGGDVDRDLTHAEQLSR